MSNTKHTPEPWAHVPHQSNDIALIQTSNGWHIGELWTLDKEINSAANAGRIVTCVNAMEGIDDPKKLRETWDAIKHLELDAYHKAHEIIQQLIKALHQIEADTRELHPAIAEIARKAIEQVG
jgi:hypothetical protein